MRLSLGHVTSTHVRGAGPVEPGVRIIEIVLKVEQEIGSRTIVIGDSVERVGRSTWDELSSKVVIDARKKNIL